MCAQDAKKKEIDRKIDETWNILTDFEKNLKERDNALEFDKELALLSRFKFALTNVLSHHMLFIEDEKQTLQSINFKGTKELENYNFTTGKSLYFVHLDKKKRLFHCGQYDYDSRYWFEAVPVKMQILKLDKDGDTISVEYLFDDHQSKSGDKNKNDSDIPAVHRIPRMIGKINMEAISEWIWYLYDCEVITDNMGKEMLDQRENGTVTDLESYLKKLCEEFSSYFERFTAKPGDWLKIYLLLYANLTNNLLVVTDESDDTPKDEQAPTETEKSPVVASG